MSTDSSFNIYLPWETLFVPYTVYIFFSLSITYLIFIFTGGVDGYAVVGSGNGYTSLTRSQFYWPVTQFVSFLTQAIIPAIFIANLPTRFFPFLISTLKFTIIFLLIYGLLQFIVYFFTGNILNRMLTHSFGIPNEVINGIDILRPYSFAGEPKMFGAFLVGSLYFLVCNEKKIHKKIFYAVFCSLMIILTLSTSAYIAFMISFIVVLYFVLPGKLYTCGVISLSLLLIVFVNTDFGKILLEDRLLNRIESLIAISGLMDTKLNTGYYVAGRALDGSLFYYLAHMLENPLASFFGYGYGNLAMGVKDGVTFLTEGDLSFAKHMQTRLYGYQLLVETGIIGLFLYTLLHYRIFKFSESFDRLCSSFESRVGMALRNGMLAHFISSLIEVHFTSFIFIGLILLHVRYMKEKNDSFGTAFS